MSISRFPKDAPARVDVRAIEREIARLWKALSEHSDPSRGGGTPLPITRICMLTLVAVAPDETSAARASDVTDRVIARYPCRSIVIQIDAGASSGLDAWLSVHCHRADPLRPNVCCEQISIAAGGRALSRVSGVVLPLLVPDLPVWLWWPGVVPLENAAGAEVFRRLIEVADCLVVDSMIMERSLSTLARVTALARSLTGGVRDFTWGRLTPWRDLVAQCFDPPQMAASLERLERVRITACQGRPGADPVASLLLAGWLASRLGWEAEGRAERVGDAASVRFRRPGGAAVIELRGGAGAVSGVELWTGDPEALSIGITRGSGDGHAGVEIRLGRARSRSHTASFSDPDDAVLLAHELDLAGPSHVFEGALEIAAGIGTGT